MLVETIDRGNEVEFTIAFLNRNGDPVSPLSATLTINFVDSAGERTDQIIPLVPAPENTWYAKWDSQQAQPAPTYWTVRSFTPDSAEDGFFVLSANLANLADQSTA